MSYYLNIHTTTYIRPVCAPEVMTNNIFVFGPDINTPLEAKAQILGAPDLYIMSGSSLRLVCRLQGSTQAPVFVFWYHSDRMINFDTDRGLIVHINSTESDLIMPYTNTSDSGNYTCQPENISPATIHVHVLQCECIINANTNNNVHGTRKHKSYIKINFITKNFNLSRTYGFNIINFD